MTDSEKKAKIFLNGVETGRIEIFKQIELIMKNRIFPDQYIDNQLIDLMKRYGYDGYENS